MEARATLFALLFILLCGPPLSAETDSDKLSFFSSGPPEQLAERLIGEMTDTELLGQVLLLGYFGTRPSGDILRWIRDKKIGGIKIFGWNAHSLPELADSIGQMQKAAAENRLQIPLFVATDQEGGWVRHVKGDTSITPGNLAIGATGLPYDAYHTGNYIGRELHSLGINMNFAPTVDVYTNPQAHVIGPRAFSDDPMETSRLAVAYYRGMRKAGIICTAKHYPGHGNATEDSHGTLPVIHTSLKTMWERELLPYRFLSTRDLPAVMSGHLAFPEVLGDETPASLSSFFLKEVLRERIGFDGIVITDDMRMHSVIHNGMNTVDACLAALQNGNDMLMVSRDTEMYRRIWDRLYRELQENPEFRRTVTASVRRILRLKFEYLKGENAVPLYPDPGTARSKVPSPEGREFFFNQAFRSVTILREEELPFRHESGSLLVAGQLRRFLSTAGAYYPEADTYYFPYSPFYEAEERYIRELRRKAEEYDTVIFCLANPNSAQVLRELRGSSARIIVISVLTPVYLQHMPWVKTAVAVYGTGDESYAAGFAALRGLIEGCGSLPVSFSAAEESSGRAVGATPYSTGGSADQ
jgi:beta-N-acetylhexosaminidase